MPDWTRGDYIGAWIAASLAACWAAVAIPGLFTMGLGILLGFPVALCCMALVGLPLSLLAWRWGWTGWLASTAAGFVAGSICAIGLATWPHVGYSAGLVVFSGSMGALGGLAFRATLTKLGLFSPPPEPGRYHYTIRPWPMALAMAVVTGVPVTMLFTIWGSD